MEQYGKCCAGGALMRETLPSLGVRVGFLEEGTLKNNTCKDLEAREWRIYGASKHSAEVYTEY